MSDELPKAKEFAEELLRLVYREVAALDPGDDETELVKIAKVVSKHVIAQNTDPEIQLAIDVNKLNSMRLMSLRYNALLAELGCRTPEDHMFMEFQLDKRIAGRNAFAAPLIVPAHGKPN